jgi:hypothetical protein
MAWLTTTTVANYIDTRLLDELSSDANNNTRNNTVVSELLDGAKEYIQTYLAHGKRHSTPLTDSEVNASIRRAQAKIVLHDLWIRRGVEVPESVTRDRAWADESLARIRDGLQVVLETDESEANRTAVPIAAVRSNTDRDTLGLMADSRFYPYRTDS